jgi:hypothetical protein
MAGEFAQGAPTLTGRTARGLHAPLELATNFFVLFGYIKAQ